MSRKKQAKVELAPTMQNGLNAEAKSIIQNGLGEAILGFNPNTFGTQLNQVTTLFKNNRWYFVSNLRHLIAETYVEHGLVQTVVDVPVDDGMSGGVVIKTKQLEESQIEQIRVTMEENDDLGIMGQGLKWTRLFGGGGIITVTNQDPSKPFNIESLKKDSKLAFKAADLWELFYTKLNLDDDHTALNQPEFQLDKIELFDYYGKQLHRSRVMVMKGKEAPSFVRPRLRGWGLSILESLVNSLNQYYKQNNLVFEVLDEFKVDVYKIKGLTNSLLRPDGESQIRKRVQLANQQKNFQHALTMDGEDDFLQKELSFSGLAETMEGIRMQIASDMRMPLSKIFGISAAKGFQSGEDDIENYNSMVQSSIRDKAKLHILNMIKLRCQHLFQMVPTDLSIEFKPLRQLTSEQEENVKTQKFNRALQAKAAGEIDSKEFREIMNKDNLLSVQLDLSKEVLDEDSGSEDDEESASDGGESVGSGQKPQSTPHDAKEAKS